MIAEALLTFLVLSVFVSFVRAFRGIDQAVRRSGEMPPDQHLEVHGDRTVGYAALFSAIVVSFFLLAGAIP